VVSVFVRSSAAAEKSGEGMALKIRTGAKTSPNAFLFTWKAESGILSIYERQTKMCLGIPAKVIELEDSLQGKVDYLGTKVKTNFTLLEDIKKGDWVIVHAGFAISKLDEEEAQETLEILREFSLTSSEPK
jgi:hydrogenase expression/formation protein HypC